MKRRLHPRGGKTPTDRANRAIGILKARGFSVEVLGNRFQINAAIVDCETLIGLARFTGAVIEARKRPLIHYARLVPLQPVAVAP